jgi:hypothetical protein
MNEAVVFDMIVEYLVDNTPHITSNQARGNYELIDWDSHYVEIDVWGLDYKMENAFVEWEEDFNREYAGEWEVTVGAHRNGVNTVIARKLN